jgi:osmotically-inducible protein OsmY
MKKEEDLLQDDDFFQLEDGEIVEEVMNVFKWNMEVPDGKVKIKVKKGWVTLEGDLEWNYQKKAAADSVTWLTGVTGVTNNIRVNRKSHQMIGNKDIEDKLRQTWALAALHIVVHVSGTNMTLSGIVHSVYQKGLAAKIAKMASGAWSVKNDIIVDFAYKLV